MPITVLGNAGTPIGVLDVSVRRCAFQGVDVHGR